MQRFLAIVLQLFISWPMIMPVFAASNFTAPACCRKNGEHHCVMMQTQTGGRGFTSVAAKCPCTMHAAVVSQTRLAGPSTSEAVFAGFVRHPAVSPQTEAGYRISFHRSRQKRGPPSFFLL
jgi:hypothetical protein